KVDASVSPVPMIWGRALVTWLDDYPYLCTEQLVSKAMGSLVGPAPRSVAGLSQAFSVLQSRQNDSGGFGLWTSSPDTAEFPTVYATHFLIEAKDRGQKIPTEMLTNTDEWLAHFASTPASTLPDARWRAYAVYLLARQGIKNPSAL